MVIDHIGPYRLVRRIGQGGMGAVFEAVHDAIERRVAIKILHPDHARNSTMVERFFNEARAANRVDHPGMVQISECGRLPNGAAYIVMEHLKGETLGRRIRRLRGRVPPVEIVRLCRQLAETLDAAHQKGIIHRVRNSGRAASGNPEYVGNGNAQGNALVRPLRTAAAGSLYTERT